MRHFLQAAYTGFAAGKAAACAGAAAVFLALVVLSGGHLGQLALLAAAIGLLAAAPGVLCARLLAARIPPGFFAPAAVLCGAAALTLTYLASMLLRAPWLPAALAWAVLAALAASGLRALCRGGAASLRKGLLAKAAAGPKPHQWLLALLFCALLLLYGFYGVVKNARPLAVGDMLLHADVLQYAGDACALKLAFPPVDIRFAGVPLYYHYLTALFAAVLSLATGVPCYPIIAFYLQPFLLAALVLCLYCFGRIAFGGHLPKTLLFTYAPFLFGCASLWKILPNGLSVFWNSATVHHITNINSQTTATVFLCVFAGLFVSLSRRGYKAPFAQHALAVLAFAMVSLAKGPLATILVAAAAAALFVGLFQRRTGWRGALLGLALAAVFAASYAALFAPSQATEGVKAIAFRLSGTLEKGYFKNILAAVATRGQMAWAAAVPALWLAQSFLMLPAQFGLYARGVWGDVRRLARLAPERLWYHAAAVGGLLAYFLFDHNGMSQVYFFIAGGFFVNLLAVDGAGRLAALWQGAGLGRAVRARPPRGAWLKRGALAFLAVWAAVGVATTGFLYVHMLGSGARQLGRNLGLIEKYPYDLVVTADDEAAMLWLREHSPQNAVFATNRIHSGRRYEGVSNLYSAFAERQAFCDGFQYTYYNAGLSNDDVVRRLRVNEAIFSAATPQEEVLRLCRENDISYLVFCAQMEGIDASDTQLAGLPLVYDSPPVRVYALPAE